MREQLDGYPVVIDVPVAWGEMDAFRHVNNIVYFRYFESARMECFLRIGLVDLLERTGVGPILASTSCRFRFPLTYPDAVAIGTRIDDGVAGFIVPMLVYFFGSGIASPSATAMAMEPVPQLAGTASSATRTDEWRPRERG